MKMGIYVADVPREVWLRGSRDERRVPLLDCLDRAAHEGLKLKRTFDDVPSRDEEEVVDFETVDGCCRVLAVDEIRAANGGRLKLKGKIDRRSVPERALRNSGAWRLPAATESAAQ